MSGGMQGMGNLDMNAQMNPEMAASYGWQRTRGTTIGDVWEIMLHHRRYGRSMSMSGGMMEGGMNLGQVSAAMGTGIDPGKAMGSVAGAAMAANEAGSGLAGAAMGAAMSAQGAAASAMGSTCHGSSNGSWRYG
jgi:hypothetical protein